MIKFFRKIRQNLLSENKFSKYLIYAIGEIVLVVIGILIALTLNNNNEKEKSEAKVLIVFNELLEELTSDIKSIKKAGMFYEQKDSLSFLVLNTELTKEDYQNDIRSYYQLTGGTTSLDLGNNSYNKLLQMSEAIPIEYSEVMKELYLLNQKKIYIDGRTIQMRNLVQDIISYNVYNYSWEINFNQQEFIDYAYSDNRYKSDVRLLSDYGANVHFRHALYYMDRAVICYKKISSLLNKPIDYTLLGYDPEISKILIGDWESEQLPGIIHTIYEDDKRLLHKNQSNINPDIGEYFVLSNTKLISHNESNMWFLTISKEENETILHGIAGSVWKKTKG